MTKWPHRCDTHPVAQCTTLQPCWQKLGQEITERLLLKKCHRLTSFSILLQYIRWVIFSWPSLLLSLTTTCNYSVRGGDTGSGCGGHCNVCVSLNMSPLYSELSTKVVNSQTSRVTVGFDFHCCIYRNTTGSSIGNWFFFYQQTWQPYITHNNLHFVTSNYYFLSFSPANH